MWFFDTPGTPGGVSIVERMFLGSKQPVCQWNLTFFHKDDYYRLVCIRYYQKPTLICIFSHNCHNSVDNKRTKVINSGYSVWWYLGIYKEAWNLKYHSRGNGLWQSKVFSTYLNSLIEPRLVYMHTQKPKKLISNAR